ncbi:TetR family transcriptional regulator [Bacillus sp. RG28]|uniref:TetR family transcriptional regulator n=1 Tax=Gottfriedia endophytica TaxID=2820819 RepID=A0A940NTD9_9BACI|nr:TetR family transcriptional regulator [Gottfriedia endophytica]MBP0724528.1 TetR family transcriptional regulator [Gottfriedia endophytica]
MPKVSEEYKKKRKEEILEIASRIFIEKGFEETTMTDIVEASQLSRGGVYKYFSSTDEMFKEIVKKYDQQRDVNIEKIIAESETAWQAIEEFLDRSEKNLINSGLGFGIVQFEYTVNSCRKENRTAYLIKRFEEVIKNLGRLIENGVQTNEFKPIQPVNAIIMFIINVLDGILLFRMLSIGIVAPEEVYIKEQISGLKMYLKGVLQVSEIN